MLLDHHTLMGSPHPIAGTSILLDPLWNPHPARTLMGPLRPDDSLPHPTGTHSFPGPPTPPRTLIPPVPPMGHSPRPLSPARGWGSLRGLGEVGSVLGRRTILGVKIILGTVVSGLRGGRTELEGGCSGWGTILGGLHGTGIVGGIMGAVTGGRICTGNGRAALGEDYSRGREGYCTRGITGWGGCSESGSGTGRGDIPGGCMRWSRGCSRG